MWFGRKNNKDKPEALTAGLCECGHGRSVHRDGSGSCVVDTSHRISEEIRKEHPGGYWTCACQIYIPQKTNQDGETPITQGVH